MDALTGINTRATPQTVAVDARQAANHAGGFAFTITPEARLRRFLVLGTDGGTYYTDAAALTGDNAAIVLDFARNRTAEMVTEILAVSLAGRAPKPNPALFALAAAAALGPDAGRRAALDVLPRVARTGTHLFLFARYVEQFRGWGRGLRRAIGDWYLAKPVDQLAYQALKYRQREGWSHRDLLRLAHPATDEAARKRVFDYICRGATDVADLPPLLAGFERAQVADPRDVAALVGDYDLSWEMLPDAALALPETWEALLDKGMPQTALIRQLPRLTALGLLEPLGARTAAVAAQLADPEQLRRGRVHPISALVALRTYSAGRSARGAGEWVPSRPIVDALDAAFYAAFDAVEPFGKRHLLALDVSGSMTVRIAGLPITAREASTALALVTAATESTCSIVGFTSSGDGWYESALTPLTIGPRQRLDDALAVVRNLPFGGTDCALPMEWALRNEVEVDVFSVYTDNETWAGAIHPHQALRRYRERMGIDAKLVVVGMTATRFSIADPADAGMLDVAGFDSAVPELIGGFARGEL